MPMIGRPACSGATAATATTRNSPGSADIKRAPLTAAEKRAYRERMERIEAERAAEDAAASAAAEARANRLWLEAVDCDEHPYLERKGIRSHGLRVGRWEVIDQDTGDVRTVTNKALLIPMRDFEEAHP